jgi:hypothetical protein
MSDNPMIRERRQVNYNLGCLARKVTPRRSQTAHGAENGATWSRASDVQFAWQERKFRRCRRGNLFTCRESLQAFCVSGLTLRLAVKTDPLA